MSRRTLKPCPFCAGPGQYMASNLPEDAEVQCSNQECPVLVMSCAGTDEEAAAKWNRRAEDVHALHTARWAALALLVGMLLGAIITLGVHHG